MIQRVYESAKKAKSLTSLVIATDHKRIYQACRDFGAEVRMTSPRHSSGTERAAEIAQKLNTSIVINIQADEPFISGEMVDKLVAALEDESIPMATLAAKVKNLNLLYDKNTVKVVTDKHGFALYFSRSPLPFRCSDYLLQHIGVYGYQKDFLLQLTRLNPSRLEKAEKLEQLRALENGYKIKIIESPVSTLSVDSPQDIIKAEKYLKTRNHE